VGVVCVVFFAKIWRFGKNSLILQPKRKGEKKMMTKSEALRRFKAAKQKKMDAVAALEQMMRNSYEERTGQKAKYVVTL
jgi:hypothetical protein